MLFFPVALIGVTTSYSKGSLLSVEDVETQAVQNGIKYVGITDKIQNFWIEDIMSRSTGTVKFFAVPERLVNVENEYVKVYVYPKTLEELRKLSQMEFHLKTSELRNLDSIVFYAGNDKRHIKLLQELFFSKLGVAITHANKNLAESLVSNIDFFLPFHHINAPKDCDKFKFVEKIIKSEIYPFIHATNILALIEGTSEELQSKILHTIEHINDIRELRKNTTYTLNEQYSSLLWALISDKIKVDDEVRKEFICIKESELSEFFYKLLITIIEFSKYGYITSDILSTSVILRRMRLIKMNTSSKIIPLRFFLKEKPLYLDILCSSQQKIFRDLLIKNFGNSMFHKVYPVHISNGLISQILTNYKLDESSALVKYLKNIVVSYRVSRGLFYSRGFLVQYYKGKEDTNLAFCGKSYEAVITLKKIKNPINIPVFESEKIFETIKSDESFIVPSVAGIFWNKLRKVYPLKGFRNCLKFFHFSHILSTKPYLRHLVYEAIKEDVPVFIEEILPINSSDKVKENLLNIVFLKDKTSTVLEEVDLFRLIIDENIPKDKAQTIIGNITKYKPILGTESIEKQMFYEFLFLAYLKQQDIKKFLASVLNDESLMGNRFKLNIILQLLSKSFEIIPPNINGNVKTFAISDQTIRLPLVICNVKKNFLREIMGERENGRFSDFYDFYKRIGKRYPRETNKLVKCGAFDKTNDRSILLNLRGNLTPEEILRIIISNEVRIMGVSPSLLKSDLQIIRSGCSSIIDISNEGENKVFGFIAETDKYDNFFLQDETGIIYVKNKMYNLRKGQSGFFNIRTSQVDDLGNDFYCTYYSPKI